MSATLDGPNLRDQLIQHLDAGNRLQAHTLVIGEARRVKSIVGEDMFPLIGDAAFTTVRDRLRRCDEAMASLLGLVAAGCFGGNQEMAPTWTDVIEFMSEFPQPQQQYVTRLRRLRAYPALLLAYGAGVAAVAGRNYRVLGALLTDAKIVNPRTDEEQPLPNSLYPDQVLEGQLAPGVFSDEPETPDLNGHLRRTLRPVMLDLIPSDRRFEEAFDRFEALLALTHADLNHRNGRTNWHWVPMGEFHRRRGNQPSVWETMKAEADAQGTDWAVLQAGLLRGSLDYYNEIKEAVDQYLARTRVVL